MHKYSVLPGPTTGTFNDTRSCTGIMHDTKWVFGDMIDRRVPTRKGRYRGLRWARLLTPLKDNQQPNSSESDGPPTGWNLDHFPAVREDKPSEINSRILENRGKTDGYAVSVVHRADSPFRSPLIPSPVAPGPCYLVSSVPFSILHPYLVERIQPEYLRYIVLFCVSLTQPSKLSGCSLRLL